MKQHPPPHPPFPHPHAPLPSAPNLSLDSFRQYLLGLNASSSSSSISGPNNGTRIDDQFCQCLAQMDTFFCAQNDGKNQILDENLAANNVVISPMDFHSDVGRMLYTIAILLMFSFVIFALMVRSISRSRSSAELETLLEAMRFREELDIQLRQKHRLRKAKRKVTAWLCRGNGAKLWQSSPHILLPNIIGSIRNDSLQSTGSYIPEIVISTDNNNPDELGAMYMRGMERQNSHTPSLSLIYDFSYESRKGSAAFSSLDQEDSDRIQSISDMGEGEQEALMKGTARGRRHDTK